MLLLHYQHVFYKIHNIWQDLLEWNQTTNEILYENEIRIVQDFIHYFTRKFHQIHTEFDEKCQEINQELHPELFEYAQKGIILTLLCLILEIQYKHVSQFVNQILDGIVKVDKNIPSHVRLVWNPIFDEWYENMDSILLTKTCKDLFSLR